MPCVVFLFSLPASEEVDLSDDALLLLVLLKSVTDVLDAMVSLKPSVPAL